MQSTIPFLQKQQQQQQQQQKTVENAACPSLKQSIILFRISLRWPIYIINSVDNTKLSCNTPIG